MSVTTEPTLTATPLPLPVHFSQAQKSFSLKKRRLPFSSSSSSSSSLSPPPILSHSLPPRPPSKGCPPVSRVFSQRPPSPWTPHSLSLSHTPPPSTLYDPSRPQSYFCQCFINLGLLGRGSFGEVYKVLSRQDGRLYAVKRTVQRFRGSKDRQRSLQEARNHECLGPHPHILGFQAAWEERGHLYIQTELCCTTLLVHSEARDTSLDEALVWGYLCDLLSALQHLHSQGFVHLDVKPANVFLTASGRLKLGDFGLMIKMKQKEGEASGGKEAVEERDEGQEGDPRYMAPELLRGDYGPAADVFSLGVSVLEFACNIEVPKGGDGWQQLRQGSLPIEFTNALSTDLQSVLKIMLVPDPSARATVAELLALPSVRRQRLKRQAYLFFVESLLFLFSFCQSVLSLGWKLLSAVRVPFSRMLAPMAPCTPPRKSWDGDEDCATPLPSFLQMDTSSLKEDLVFPPDTLQLDHSPTFSQRGQSQMSLGSTSTPLPHVTASCDHSVSRTPTPTHSWRVTQTPNSTKYFDETSSDATPLAHSLTQAGGSSNESTRSRPTSASNSPFLHQMKPSCHPRPAFEPKNLLSLFDETMLEGPP